MVWGSFAVRASPGERCSASSKAVLRGRRGFWQRAIIDGPCAWIISKSSTVDCPAQRSFVPFRRPASTAAGPLAVEFERARESERRACQAWRVASQDRRPPKPLPASVVASLHCCRAARGRLYRTVYLQYFGRLLPSPITKPDRPENPSSKDQPHVGQQRPTNIGLQTSICHPPQRPRIRPLTQLTS
jgi:hypothetical protein